MNLVWIPLVQIFGKGETIRSSMESGSDLQTFDSVLMIVHICQQAHILAFLSPHPWSKMK